MRDEVIEIYDDPKYGYGAKVVSRKNVRNDGTFPGKDIGELLVKKGDVGYVNSIGTFLQRYYIYGVDFIERGYIVGMRVHELDLIEEEPKR
ncbi:nitrogen fixation protein NifZ [Caenispirillum bisanense]|uniref:nitrogen fixation protein NifZ n=1 Tax=Caenispirillum bisanense TaxID=414052 RepID=UPI0031DD7C11